MEIIDVSQLNEKEKQALVCLFFARLHKSDMRYKQRDEYFNILSVRYNRKPRNYGYDKDALDPYFPNNGRKGWTNKPVEKRSKVLKTVLDEYADVDDAVLEVAVKEIIDICKAESRTVSFVAARVQQPEQAHALKDSNNATFTIDGIYTLQSAMTQNRIVFLALGGDAGQASVDWERGFYAIGHVIKEPYDIGYKQRTGSPYYKVDLHIDWRCKEALSKDLLRSYPDTNDAPYMGLEIHRDPTQAVCQLEDTKAVAIIRAVIDKYPDAIDVLKNIFSNDFMERVQGMAKRIIEVTVDHGQSIASAMKETIDAIETKDDEDVLSEERVTGARNLILFGAPGTGKSHLLKEQQKDLVEDTNNFERVTFHPDYTYANFVGCYKPVPAKDEAGKDIITYKYVPGPFMRMLVKALLNPKQAHLLIIEEINRANVAAVFGDVFQLLDRDANGVSEYAIQTSEDMRGYLSKVLNIDVSKVESIRIPNNLYLWATMNSADQGVYPMDTAFKRRWDFEYIDIDNNDKDINHYWFEVAGVKIHWNSLRKAINKELTDNGINEDKLMGAFFVSKNVIDENNNEKFIKAFCNKVIMYLFEDAARQKPGRIFELDNAKTRYSALCKDFEKNGINIFVANIVEEYKRLAETQVTTTNQEQTVETVETVE